MADPLIAQFSRRQHSLVTHAQALEVWTETELKDRLRERRLEPLRRSVYRVAGAPETWHQHALAACLAAGDGAVASFATAATLWGFHDFIPDQLEITVPDRQRTRLAGVTVHNSFVSGHRHVGARSLIPVTSAARTLCDMTAWLPGTAIERHVDEALRRKLTTLRTLGAVADDLGGPGRRRSTVMRAILENRLPGYHPGDSNPEVRIANLLERAGLPRPVLQYRIQIGTRTVRSDLAYPELMILIEYDSWRYHSSRTEFDRDRARDRKLELMGFTVLRYTSESANSVIVAEVEEAVALARARGTDLFRAVVS